MFLQKKSREGQQRLIIKSPEAERGLQRTKRYCCTSAGLMHSRASARTGGRLLLAMEKTPPSIVPLHTRLSHVGNWFMPATVHKLSNVPICTEILGTTDSGDKSEKTILTNDVSQYKAAAYVQCDRSCIQKSAH